MSITLFLNQKNMYPKPQDKPISYLNQKHQPALITENLKRKKKPARRTG